MRDPVVCPSEDCKLYEVIQGFRTEHELLPGGALWVPPGFLFDGASVPRFFWRIVSPGEPWVLRGSCVHDMLCDLEVGRAYDAAVVFRDLIAEDAQTAGKPKRLVTAMFKAVSDWGPQFGNQPINRLNRRPFESH